MEDTGDALKRQDSFYETIRENLETESFGKWAVVSNDKLVGVYDSNRKASEAALELTPNQVCLVKRIGHDINVSQLMVRANRAPVRRAAAKAPSPVAQRKARPFPNSVDSHPLFCYRSCTTPTASPVGSRPPSEAVSVFLSRIVLTAALSPDTVHVPPLSLRR